jgi:hypothetical protein
MTRLKPGFHHSNGEFVTSDSRVEYRFGARHGTVNAIFQDGEAEVIFDDNADLYLVKWSHLQITVLGRKNMKTSASNRPPKNTSGPASGRSVRLEFPSKERR